MSLLELRGLCVSPGQAKSPSVRELDLELAEGAALGIVGPSGCGKSTLARALVGIEPRTNGSLRYRDRELVGASEREWNRMRREVALCWQDASAALDPHLTIARSVGEARSLAGQPTFSGAQLSALLERFSLPPDAAARFPAQLSGGQRQRAALARALATAPRLVIADEVTSALDRAVALEIVDILRGIREEQSALIFITHDLSLLPGLVDEVRVLDSGRVVDRGTPAELLRAPSHPTTRALVDAIPRLSPRSQ